MFVVVSSYILVSQSLHMLHLVLFLAYSEHNLTKHLKPPKLVEFVSLKENNAYKYVYTYFIY